MKKTTNTKNQNRKRARAIGCELKYSGKLGRGFIHPLVPRKPFVPQEQPDQEPEDPCYE